LKTLSIDLDDLTMALSTRYELDDPSHYLDLDSGEVIYAGEGLEGLPADLATNTARYAWIESVEAEPALQIMADFIAQLSDENDRNALTEAFEDNEPFDAFTDALAELPHLRGQWVPFQLAAYTELARQWCQDHGIDPQ
jgi:GNAT superfamily N-acetyltransferase